MLKLLLSLLFISSMLFAEDNTVSFEEENDVYYEDENESDTTVTERLQESDLYLSYETVPTKIYRNQIFTLKTKILNTNKKYSKLLTSYGTFYGLNVLFSQPSRKVDEFTSYDTYYFQAKESKLRTPTLNYKLHRSYEDDVDPISLEGKEFYTVELNSDEDFTNVLALNFTIDSYKTTNYDEDHNIIVFSASSEMGNIADFNLSFAEIQGFETLSRTLPKGHMTYYAVIAKHLRNLRFNYFNLTTSHYENINIPIEVDDDSVSTQMDLAPTQYTHTLAKIMLALVFILVGVVLYLFTHQKRYFFVIALTPILYVAWVYFPKTQLCIKMDSKIYLLPMSSSTIFYKYTSDLKLQQLGEVDDYKKVLLPNRNIGWVKNEDICED